MSPNGGVHQGTKPNPLGLLFIIQMNDLDPAFAPTKFEDDTAVQESFKQARIKNSGRGERGQGPK